MEPVVLRLPRVDPPVDEPGFVLVHVSPAGRRPLDLKLIGTENSTEFSVSLKHNQTSSLKENKSTINQEQWEGILSTVILGTAPEEGQAGTEGIEAVAKVDESAINILIQRRVEGITQKLGSLSLPAKEDAGVDLYEWCGIAVKANEGQSRELKEVMGALKDKDEEIAKLKESLEELVKLKNENEAQLLEKFSLLLNEKKLKIRDQQRILLTSNVDPTKLEEVEQSRVAIRAHSAGPSRKGKRKAGENTQDSDDESDGFEKMDVDKEVSNKVPNDSEEDRQTPDESTADEASDNDVPPAAPPTRKPANDTKMSSNNSAPDSTASTSTAPPEQIAPPPKRELPFAKKPAVSAKPAPVDGSETESDDDEL